MATSRADMRLLIVEDDTKLVRALKLGLEREGYAVDASEDGDEALALAEATDYDAIVLDLMLPGLDGFSVCEDAPRGGRWMPVLMLTARTGVADRIRGLDAGADDYLVKPFDFGELLARLRALLRRGPVERPAIVSIGDLVIDSDTRVVTRAGEEIELTAREYDVLAFLARQPGARRLALGAARAGLGGLRRLAEHHRRLRRLPAQEAGPGAHPHGPGIGFVLEAP